MRERSRSSSRKAVLGAVGVLLLALAVAVSVAAGGKNHSYVVRAIFDDAANVIPGEEVKVAGANVGTVGAVTPTPQAQRRRRTEDRKRGLPELPHGRELHRPAAVAARREVRRLPADPAAPGRHAAAAAAEEDPRRAGRRRPVPAAGHEHAQPGRRRPPRRPAAPARTRALHDHPQRTRRGPRGTRQRPERSDPPREPRAAGTRPRALDPREREPRPLEARRRLRTRRSPRWPGCASSSPTPSPKAPRSRGRRANQSKALAGNLSLFPRFLEELGPAMDRLGHFSDETMPSGRSPRLRPRSPSSSSRPRRSPPLRKILHRPRQVGKQTGPRWCRRCRCSNSSRNSAAPACRSRPTSPRCSRACGPPAGSSASWTSSSSPRAPPTATTSSGTSCARKASATTCLKVEVTEKSGCGRNFFSEGSAQASSTASVALRLDLLRRSRARSRRSTASRPRPGRGSAGASDGPPQVPARTMNDDDARKPPRRERTPVATTSPPPDPAARRRHRRRRACRRARRRAACPGGASRASACSRSIVFGLSLLVFSGSGIGDIQADLLRSRAARQGRPGPGRRRARRLGHGIALTQELQGARDDPSRIVARAASPRHDRRNPRALAVERRQPLRRDLAGAEQLPRDREGGTIPTSATQSRRPRRTLQRAQPRDAQGACSRSSKASRSSTKTRASPSAHPSNSSRRRFARSRKSSPNSCTTRRSSRASSSKPPRRHRHRRAQRTARRPDLQRRHDVRSDRRRTRRELTRSLQTAADHAPPGQRNVRRTARDADRADAADRSLEAEDTGADRRCFEDCARSSTPRRPVSDLATAFNKPGPNNDLTDARARHPVARARQLETTRRTP